MSKTLRKSCANSQIKYLKDNLRRLEQVINGPYARPADFFLRARIARQLHEALRSKAA